MEPSEFLAVAPCSPLAPKRAGSASDFRAAAYGPDYYYEAIGAGEAACPARPAAP